MVIESQGQWEIHWYLNDFTARPQLIDKDSNPGYYEIVKAFESTTGVGSLLNTSFNLHGEPIVNTASDAIRVFENSDLDILLLNNWLLEKRIIYIN